MEQLSAIFLLDNFVSIFSGDTALIVGMDNLSAAVTTQVAF
jgi:hypothetical protein